MNIHPCIIFSSFVNKSHSNSSNARKLCQSIYSKYLSLLFTSSTLFTSPYGANAQVQSANRDIYLQKRYLILTRG